MTCTVASGSGVTIITERIITRARPKWIRRDQRPVLTVFCGAGRGTSALVALVPLTAMGSTLMPNTSAFGWCVSWSSYGRRVLDLLLLRHAYVAKICLEYSTRFGIIKRNTG
jgi:hypothetical protein